jgi:hypothetical protein
VPTYADYACLEPAALLARLDRMPGELDAAVRTHPDETLRHRPAPASWSPLEGQT